MDQLMHIERNEKGRGGEGEGEGVKVEKEKKWRIIYRGGIAQFPS